MPSARGVHKVTREAAGLVAGLHKDHTELNKEFKGQNVQVSFVFCKKIVWIRRENQGSKQCDKTS